MRRERLVHSLGLIRYRYRRHTDNQPSLRRICQRLHTLPSSLHQRRPSISEKRYVRPNARPHLETARLRLVGADGRRSAAAASLRHPNSHRPARSPPVSASRREFAPEAPVPPFPPAPSLRARSGHPLRAASPPPSRILDSSDRSAHSSSQRSIVCMTERIS